MKPYIPTFQNRYHFRSGTGTGVWYLTCINSGAIYSLIYDGEPPAWRVGSVTGLSTIRAEIEAEVKRLCPMNP
jgi:hypothetical protein